MAELTVQESRIELQKLADEVAAYYTTEAMEERAENQRKPYIDGGREEDWRW